MTSQDLINSAAKNESIQRICTKNPEAIQYVQHYAKRGIIQDILSYLGEKIIPTLLTILEKILIKKYG